MGIKINVESYERASDDLSESMPHFSNARNAINNTLSGIDSRVANVVRSNLNTISTSLDDLGFELKKIANHILDKKDEIVDLEKKYTTPLDTLTSSIPGPLGSLSTLLGGNVVSDSGKKQAISNELLAKIVGADVNDAKAMADCESLNEKMYYVATAISLVLSSTGAKTATSSESSLYPKGYDDSTFWGGVRSVGEDIFTGVKKTGASVGNGVVALTQGVGEFGEALVDTGAIVVSGVSSIFTGGYDGYQFVKGKITGNENWTSETKAMWADTMDFVGTSYVKDAYDDFHANTIIGQTLDEYAYSPFKSTGGVYKFLDGVGYTAGIVALTLATLGVGGAVSAGAGGASTLSTAGTQAVIAGTAGFGKGADEAWGEGASLGEGLTYAAGNALWESAQYYLGGKVGTSGGIADQLAGKMLGSGATNLQQNLLKAGITSSLDGLTGAAEGFVNPMLDSIYKDGYFNENGEFVKFTADQGFIKKYIELFDDNGGWSAVGTQAALGATFSLMDLGLEYWNLRPNTNMNIDDVQLLNIDADDVMSVSFDDSLANTNLSSTSDENTYPKEEILTFIHDVKDFLSSNKDKLKNGLEIEGARLETNPGYVSNSSVLINENSSNRELRNVVSPTRPILSESERDSLDLSSSLKREVLEKSKTLVDEASDIQPEIVSSSVTEESKTLSGSVVPEVLDPTPEVIATSTLSTPNLEQNIVQQQENIEPQLVTPEGSQVVSEATTLSSQPEFVQEVVQPTTLEAQQNIVNPTDVLQQESIVMSTPSNVGEYTSLPDKGFVVTKGNQTYNLSDRDLELLTAIVSAECDKTGDDALATVTVILNRCESPAWIASYGTDPIKQATARNQFVVYQNGMYKKYMGDGAPPQVAQAVKDALGGVRNSDYLSFRSNGSTGYSSNMISPTGNRYG